MADWFSRLFEHNEPLRHQFGRGINASVAPQEPELYNDAMIAFEEGRILDAYKDFLTSLQNFKEEKATGNITIREEKDALYFELLQGSLIVKGKVTDKLFEARALIADASGCNVAIKRRLIERNYQLTYARYYIHNDRIYLKIYLDNTTMSPQKVFYPLRELALNGDYEKEYIVSEFGDSCLLETSHVTAMSEDEKTLKYRCLQAWIGEGQERIKHLPANDNAGMIAFTYLTLLMQIDYLLVPRQKIGRDIIRHVTDYFNDEEKSVEQKNMELQTFLEELGELTFDTFAPQLYRLTLTFSPMERASHDEIATFIEETFNKVRWYKSNRYQRVIMTIYRYIPLYLLYNYGVHPSLQELLHLLVQIQQSDFFAELGYAPLYDAQNERFEKRIIAQRIAKAIKPYEEQFPQLEDFSQTLNYSDLEKFSYSFLLQVKHLDYSEL
jgi:hypothetical protein